MPARPSLCLCMIVRNEAPVISRCLASVLPIIDYWVIVDTGSTDGTQEIIADFLQGVPGELVERPWVDFGHNRTEALGYARHRGHYVFVIDADEVLEIHEEFARESLTADAYLVETHYGGIAYMRKQILRNDLDWRYEGVLHEHAVCEQSTDDQEARGLRILVHHDGARARDPKTYRRDAIALETALIDEPVNARYVFYLAQSYADAGDLELAVRNYGRRTEMAGWSDEIWFSLYRIACLHERMSWPWAVVMEEYLKAFQHDPLRAEPLFRIGSHYHQAGDDQVARLFLARGMSLGYPSRRCLFIERDVYEYRLALEYAAACSGSGEHAEAIATCNVLLRGRSLPVAAADRARGIRKLSLANRHRSPAAPPASPVHVTVCVPFRDPGPDFDDCVESLLLQTTSAFDMVFIDDGSGEDCRSRLPVAGAARRIVRYETPIGFDACVGRLIAEDRGPDEVMIVWGGATGFASRNLVEQVLMWFGDADCMLLYGQHRLATGRPGDAIPAASEAEFLSLGSSLASRSPICFRAQLWRPGRSPAAEEPATANVLDRSRTDDLWRAAGFERTRFTDTVLVTVPDGAPAARPGDGPAGCSPRVRPCTPLKVSCLMVTGERVTLAKRAIRCFAAQTYPHRELVVVSDGEPRVRLSLERFASALGLENVRFVHEERPERTLGALRNVALDAAAGDVVCQWDDDDGYHPDRIRVQLEHMLSGDARACLLTDHLQYLEEEDALFWVDWTLAGSDLRDQVFPGSLMMFKDDRFRYPEVGRNSAHGEDSVILYALCDEVAVAGVRDLGYLYLYTHHGRNTFDRAHHHRIAALGRSVGDLNQRKDIIRAAMPYYAIAKPYMVVGRDGPAFVLDD